ncbi:MAG: nucleotidyltransferase family protein, partial [Clostridia bacterium]|nr:nucleotidyltransferase family protein [Clostridia bacterium]
TDLVQRKFHKQLLTAVYRRELADSEFNKVTEVLEEAGIRYMPLKGSVIKDYYPESWMRTSSDIDILVHEDDLPEVSELLSEKLDYVIREKGKHDVGAITQTGMHIEMHYRLSEDEKADEILSGVWDTAKLSEGKKCCYEMSDEFFAFYHLSHMAKHFSHGGCGVRYYIDLWLINNNIMYDEKKLCSLLEDVGLTQFRKTSEDIIAMWFYGKKSDELTKRAGTFVLEGGVYGNVEQHIAVRQYGKLGKLKYILNRIFIKKNTLMFLYPEIKKYPLLVPYYMVKRWMKIFNKEKRERVKCEIKANVSLKQSKKEEVLGLMKELGI